MPIQNRIDAAVQARSIGLKEEVADLVAATDSALEILYGIAGEYSSVLTVEARQLDRLDATASRLEQVDILRRAAVYMVNIAADFEKALELGKRGYGLATNTSPHQLMHAIWPILASLYHLGRWDESAPFVAEHVRAFEEDPAVSCQFVRDGPVIGATIHAQRGERGRALALASLIGDVQQRLESASPWEARFAIAMGTADIGRAISRARALEGRLYGPQHALSLLDALVALEAWVELADLLPRARAAVAGNALLEPAIDRADGLLLARAGRVIDAVDSLRRASASYQRMKVPFEAARTQTLLARFASSAERIALAASADVTNSRLGVPAVPDQSGNP